jgi:Flp pilus assembly protein TadG
VSILRKFIHDVAGNFGIMTALTIPVLILSSGMALNVVTAANAQRQLQAASDSASLAVSEAYNSGIRDQRELEAVADRFMKSNTKTAALEPGSLHYTVSVSGTSPKLAHVNARAEVPTSFSAFMGRDTMGIVAETSTTIGTETYFQIAFLVDVSGSMAIGGTNGDIDKLYKLLNCEFACHDTGNYSAYKTGDTAAKAKAAGIKLKIDYVQSAVNLFVNTLKPVATQNPDKFQLGMYTMGTTFNLAQAMTTDMNAFSASLSNVYLEKMLPFSCAEKYGFTSIKAGLTNIIPQLTNVGDGSSANKRKTFVVMITDGSQNIPHNCGRFWSADYKAECQNVKNAGIEMFAIQTAYPAIKHDDLRQYRDGVKPLLGDMRNSMISCASSQDKFFLADDGPAIEAAIKKVFKTIFGDVRIYS